MEKDLEKGKAKAKAKEKGSMFIIPMRKKRKPNLQMELRQVPKQMLLLIMMENTLHMSLIPTLTVSSMSKSRFLCCLLCTRAWGDFGITISHLGNAPYARAQEEFRFWHYVVRPHSLCLPLLVPLVGDP